MIKCVGREQQKLKLSFNHTAIIFWRTCHEGFCRTYFEWDNFLEWWRGRNTTFSSSVGTYCSAFKVVTLGLIQICIANNFNWFHIAYLLLSAKRAMCIHQLLLGNLRLEFPWWGLGTKDGSQIFCLCQFWQKSSLNIASDEVRIKYTFCEAVINYW